MTVPSPGVVLHLCLIVFAFTHISGGEGVPFILNGLLNQSIPMSLSGGPSDPVHLVIWNFKNTPLATYTNNQIIVIDEKFRGRLEILDDGRSLRIGHLRLEDSGLYTGTITFTNNTNYQKVYNLTVYEPVPTLLVEIEEKVNTSDWCNVTLRCSVSANKSSFSYTWKYKHGGSAYKLYNNTGHTLQISLQPESWDTEVLCEVKNPAESKYNSLHRFCPEFSAHPTRGDLNRNYYLLLVVVPVLIVLVLLGWSVIKMKKKRRKAGIPDVTENKNGEPQYIQVTTFQPNDDRQEWNNSLYDSSPRQKPKAVTVYATLEHPPETYR